MKDDLAILVQQLDELVLPLLSVARTRKEIDAKAYPQLRELITNIGQTLEGTESVPKSLVGTLYFIVFSLLAEADHAKDPAPLVEAAWTLEDDLRKVFGPRF